MKRAVPSALGVALAFELARGLCAAQPCTPQWWNANQGLEPQVNDFLVPHVFAEFDADGPGPQSRHLYVAGFFTFDDGQMLTPGIARWDGFDWTSVAQGLGAGGINFVLALTGHDPDGSGPLPASLIAGGIFANAGNVPVKNIARWDGSVWHSMGTGFPATSQVRALASHDQDGAGPNLPFLVAAGSFTTLADGTPCRSIARWDGASWSTTMQSPPEVSTCVALRSFDPDGAGAFPPVLLAWMAVGADGPYGVFKWTGTQWVYTGLALAETRGFFYDTSSAAAMWDSDGNEATPSVLHVCDASGLRRWLGGGWQLVPNSAGGGSLLAVVDEDGPGPLTARIFSVRSDLNVVRWDGSQWTSIGVTAGGAGVDGSPYALTGFDIDGAGPRPGSLFIGGAFRSVSGVPAHGLARYGCEEAWEPCVGDVNDDLLVNFRDITDILTNWGLTGSAENPAYGDANLDNIVGFTDITAVLTSFGQDCNAARSDPSAISIQVDPSTPMGRIWSRYQDGGFSAITRALAEWPAAE